MVGDVVICVVGVGRFVFTAVVGISIDVGEVIFTPPQAQSRVAAITTIFNIKVSCLSLLILNLGVFIP